MEYKNTRTGATFSSSCVISGGNWVPLDKELVKTVSPELTVEKAAKVSKELPLEEPEKNTVDFDGITRKQIMQELDAFGIEYNPKANKPELYALMMSQGE